MRIIRRVDIFGKVWTKDDSGNVVKLNVRIFYQDGMWLIQAPRRFAFRVRRAVEGDTGTLNFKMNGSRKSCRIVVFS